MRIALFPHTRGGRIRLAALVAVVAVVFGGGGWFMISMPGRSHRGPLPPLTEEERGVRERLERHVRALAEEIGERSLARPGSLARAARYVAE